MKLRFSVVTICLGTALASQHAYTAEPAYPSKPIRVIVGFPPAGAADIFARLVGQKLTEAWGQPVVVDNRPGAGSTIGSEIVANATPDGYTLMVVSASYATSAGLYRKLKYHPIDSFIPITQISSSANVFIAHPSVPAKSAADVIRMAKSSPGRFTIGSAGTGSITHLAGELFVSMAGIKLVHVPYKGAGPGLIALIGGEINLSFFSIPASLGHVKAGRVRALGVTSAKRSPALPEVPTVAESGIPGYEAANWFGFLAPAGTPKAIVARLNKQIVDILRSPESAQAIRKQGGEAVGGTPDAFRKHLKSEIAKWTKVIDEAGVPTQ